MKYINTKTLKVFESKDKVMDKDIMPLKNFIQATEFKPVEEFWEGEI